MHHAPAPTLRDPPHAGLAAAAVMLCLLGAGPAGAEPVRAERELMHTLVSVAINDPMTDAGYAAAFEDVFGVFADIDNTMNEWKPGSVLGQINASAGGEPVLAPAPLCEVIRKSLEGARKTNGLFDPTWAALKDVWRFGDGDAPVVPSAEAVKKACALVSYRDVEVTAATDAGVGACRVRLKKPGMKLGLGGVVKGWGVDQAVAKLRARGLKSFFIQAGGDLYFAGHKETRKWKSGIRDPRGPPDQTFAKLEVEDGAFSTSGDYEHYFEVDNVRYHHIIDLRTCWPAKASRSATVLARSATDAEFLTKSAFILGAEKGLALAESMGAAAVIVDAHNRVYVSKKIRAKLELGTPSP